MYGDSVLKGTQGCATALACVWEADCSDGSCGDRLRELGFSLDKERLNGNFLAAFQYLKHKNDEAGEKHFLQ